MDILTIKGRSPEKIEISVNHSCEFSDVVNTLKIRMEKMRTFFGGVYPVCQFSGREFSDEQKDIICTLLTDEFNIERVLFSSNNIAPQEELEIKQAILNQTEDIKTQPKPKQKKEDTLKTKKSKINTSAEYYNANSIFIKNTVRSGQRIECEGDIVVVGDVNPGAELIAGGNIAVMGTLRGLAHAGATGRTDVVISAFKLAPKQLRINTKISIFPDEDSQFPEYAMLMGDKIVINKIGKKI